MASRWAQFSGAGGRAWDLDAYVEFGQDLSVLDPHAFEAREDMAGEESEGGVQGKEQRRSLRPRLETPKGNHSSGGRSDSNGERSGGGGVLAAGQEMGTVALTPLTRGWVLEPRHQAEGRRPARVKHETGGAAFEHDLPETLAGMIDGLTVGDGERWS